MAQVGDQTPLVATIRIWEGMIWGSLYLAMVAVRQHLAWVMNILGVQLESMFWTTRTIQMSQAVVLCLRACMPPAVTFAILRGVLSMESGNSTFWISGRRTMASCLSGELISIQRLFQV